MAQFHLSARPITHEVFALLIRFLLNRLPLKLSVFLIISCFIQPGHAAVKSEAYLGEPFGVGKLTVDVLRGEPVLPLSDERFTLLEASGRVMYPALKQEPVRKLIRGLLDMEAPRKVTIYYLFAGEKSFDVSAYTPYEQGVRVNPVRYPSSHQRLLNEWWEQYNKGFQALQKDRAYPPVAENFIVATLSRRLNLPVTEQRRSLFGSMGPADNGLSDLLVDEAHLLRIDRALLSEANSAELKLQPLPKPIAWVDSEPADDTLNEVAIEPIASHVPAECFYIRFGTFTNYLWFRDLNKKWQGDLGNMVLRRGIKRAAGDRIQQQLSLRESALAKVLGPQVIADAAIIGLDHYVGQGAAIGILFQAKNEFLLSADLVKQRREALQKFEDAEEETLDIGGKSVSLIATPTGEVRSYYVKDDGFHLVTTSRILVERFLQAGQGDRSLSTLPSFQRSRREFPLERDDTIVAFISEKYWQGLSLPQSFIENQRRLKSSRVSLLSELARYAATCEGKLAQSIEELVSADILPAGFGVTPDGSETFAVEAGTVDSLRGRRGYYLPISDMPITEVSGQEAAAFQEFADKMRAGVGQMPPIAATVQRTPTKDGNTETITIDVQAQGSLRQQLGKVATWLGQPAETKMQPIDGDLLAMEAVVDFPTPLAGGENAEHHLFGALRDYRAPLVVRRGAVRPDAGPPELVRGYLGAWPKPGLLAWFTGAEQANGPQPQPIGQDLWQAKRDEFLLIAFKPDVVEQVLPQLATQPAERAAQVRVRLEDLTGTQMADNLSAFGYMRTRETSASGSRLMNSLANQLHVPRDMCREVAERLVDGEFVCPLGGEYQLYEPDRGLEVWVSSALPEQNQFLLTEIPEDYTLPFLNWFRGLNGDLCLDDQALRVHLEVEMTKAALPW